MTWQDFGRIERREGRAGGAPCFEGTGVMVSVVAKRFAAGESVADLSKEYAIPQRTIEAGLRLVLWVNGTALGSQRAQTRIEKRIPLLRRGLR